MAELAEKVGRVLSPTVADALMEAGRTEAIDLALLGPTDLPEILQGVDDTDGKYMAEIEDLAASARDFEAGWKKKVVAEAKQEARMEGKMKAVAPLMVCPKQRTPNGICADILR